MCEHTIVRRLRECYRDHSRTRVLNLRDRDRIAGGRLLPRKNSNNGVGLEINLWRRAGRSNHLPELTELTRRGDEVIHPSLYCRLRTFRDFCKRHRGRYQRSIRKVSATGGEHKDTDTNGDNCRAGENKNVSSHSFSIDARRLRPPRDVCITNFMMFSVQVPGVEPGTARVSVGCSTN